MAHDAHAHTLSAWPFWAKRLLLFCGSRQLFVSFLASQDGRKGRQENDYRCTYRLKRGIPPGAWGGIQILGMVLARPLVGTGRVCGGYRDQSASARRIGTSLCSTRHTSWSILLLLWSRYHPLPLRSMCRPHPRSRKHMPFPCRECDSSPHGRLRSSSYFKNCGDISLPNSDDELSALVVVAKPQLQHCGCAQ